MKLFALGIRVLYRLFCLFPQQNKVAFMSRQAARPFDFALLEPQLAQHLPHAHIVWACGAETTGGPQIGLTLRQLWHAATARVCIVDGYMPAIAIPPYPHRATCILLWHALGAIKKFGWQALGTSEGRTREQAEVGCMHRGYDVVVVGLPEAVDALSAGLDVVPSSIQPLGLPRIDYLLDNAFDQARIQHAQFALKECGVGGHVLGQAILYAPTLRRTAADSSALVEHTRQLVSHCARVGVEVFIAFHPLQQGIHFADFESKRAHVVPSHVPTHALFPVVECVVSDYSAVIYEAACAGKRVLFYVPDIICYLDNPGLNINPLDTWETASFTDVGALVDAVQKGKTARVLNKPASEYSGAIARIGSVVLKCYEQGK